MCVYIAKVIESTAAEQKLRFSVYKHHTHYVKSTVWCVNMSYPLKWLN